MIRSLTKCGTVAYAGWMCGVRRKDKSENEYIGGNISGTN